jgi:spermidine synthase
LMPIASTQLLETLQWKAVPAANLRFSETVETRSGIIAVTKDRTVYGNGMYDGRFNVELKNDTNGIVRPYALSLFHPLPQDVLLIGLSSGSWAQVIANNPNVKSLTVIEINPGYLKLIAAAPEVASLLQDPKVSIIIGDGRRWLRANPSRRFDAIVSNTTYHYRSNVTNLLSVEFLDLVRRHLNKGGVVFYNTTDSDRVQRTGCLAYRYGARFLNHMILSDDPIRWDFGRWRRTIESYRIDGRTEFNAADKLDREKLDTLSSWEGSLRTESGGAVRPIEPCEDTLKRTQGIATVTDDNMGSEWRHALRLD